MLTALLAFVLSAAAAAPAVEVLIKRDDVVWGFDFLPGGSIVFTERGGFLGLLDPKTGKVEEVSGAPKVRAEGQGGLLDVKLHPDFKTNRWVYLTWSEPIEGGAATAVGRGRLDGTKLEGFERLFLSNGGGSGGIHYGSRLLFDGPHLWVTLGERNERHLAQDLAKHNGKLLRLTHDGKPAGSGVSKELPEVWSYGHRNPQGIAKRPGAREIWVAEFGPRGGDELNLIKPKANYGWPVITYGREYWGPKIGPTRKEGMEQPVVQWTPVISPSGIAFHGDSLYLACLSSRHIRRVSFAGGKPGEQESLLADKKWRFRHVRPGPDGKLYFSTDEGRIGRLAPL